MHAVVAGAMPLATHVPVASHLSPVEHGFPSVQVVLVGSGSLVHLSEASGLQKSYTQSPDTLSLQCEAVGIAAHVPAAVHWPSQIEV
jgi:hypothetical protein